MEDDKTKNEEAQEAVEEKEAVNQEREAQESEKKPDRPLRLTLTSFLNRSLANGQRKKTIKWLRLKSWSP